MKQYEKGLNGEQQAEEYLCGLGMRCMHRRFRAEDGEIDLIMQDGDTIVMVEVKYRPRGYAGDGLSAVTPAKQKRMLHAALAFLSQRDWVNRSVRFDVVEITSMGVLHIPNAFMPGMY